MGGMMHMCMSYGKQKCQNNTQNSEADLFNIAQVLTRNQLFLGISDLKGLGREVFMELQGGWVLR